MGARQQGGTQRLNPADLADDFLNKRGFATSAGLHLRRYRGDWLQFDGRVFRPLSDEEIKADVMAFLRATKARPSATTHLLNSTITHLQSICLVPNAVEWPARQSGNKWVAQQHCVVMQNEINDQLFERNQRASAFSSYPRSIKSGELALSLRSPSHLSPMDHLSAKILPDPESRRLLQ